MKPSRNSSCPCGSGKKYKRCCLASGRYEVEEDEQSPDNVLASARVAFKQGNDSVALQMANHLQKSAPELAGAWELAGTVEFQAENFPAAKDYFARAAELEPGNPTTLYYLATTMGLSGQQENAVDVFRRALAIKPDFHQVYVNLGNTLRDLGRADEAVECYVEVFRHGEASLAIMSHILLSMHLFALDDYAPLYEMHCMLGEKIAAKVPAKRAGRSDITARENGKIRLGYVSPRFSREIVGHFFKPIFDAHNREKFELYLYSATKRTDELSETFAEAADQWCDATAMSDAALCEQIVRDEIDILIDLAGHAPENRITAIASKPAPIVVSMLDYFDTTGVKAFDYYVTDGFSTPPDSRQQFTEELLVLNQPRLVYVAPDYAPPVTVRAGSADTMVFGSFNRHHKITPAVVKVWAQLLRAVPNSILRLKNKSFVEADVQQSYLRQFADAGIDAERIDFQGASPHAQMLADYGEIDIALDTFPYNGGLTTCEALWMGTPVLALEGDRVISRQSACMLHAVGLSTFIAQDSDEFAGIGKYWSENIEQLHSLRAGLRGQMAQSPLVDARAYTADLETQLGAIWQRYLTSPGDA
jgi:protein O-GlcNAc transferase